MSILRAFVVLLCFVASAVHAAEPFALSWPSRLKISRGEIAQLKVHGERLSSVEGQWAEGNLAFYIVAPGLFAAIIGVDLEAKPGTSKITLTATNDAGRQRRAETIVERLPKPFRQESFTVAPGFDQLSPQALELIRIERADFALAFSTPSAQRLWEPPFIRPVPQESSSSFGYRRIINGKARAPHTGADLRAPVGTEVLAANHGRVVLVGNYFFAGQSIVLDHGGGLYTMYFHLSDFKVDAGALVRRGDVIALSGMSGRVTGPHLHWAARLGNARVDPMELIEKIPSVLPQQAG
jgi:murein DD-endopeptidase MepM/ murein hydrolase activator NlpD